MTPTELNKLPEDQQKNALLAIALGYEIVWAGGNQYWSVYTPYGNSIIPIMLYDWQPQNDKALMWDLVCELSAYYFKNKSKYIFVGHTKNAEKILIADYISADLKGNRAKWDEDHG